MIILVLFLCGHVASQTGQIKGRILDDANQSLPGAGIIITGTKYTAVSDINGYYHLQNIPAGKINNVDLRDGFASKNRKVALVAGSNRDNNCITLFYIDPDTGLLSDTMINIYICLVQSS
jgi:myo-inositol-hexaphosphate 3-phosphohydrolase